MNKYFSGLSIPLTKMTVLILFTVTMLASSMAFAAVHNITLTAETLPNGQLAYKLSGEARAAIPGPTLFVKQGDSVNVTLTNNTAVPVSFKVPGVRMRRPPRSTR